MVEVEWIFVECAILRLCFAGDHSPSLLLLYCHHHWLVHSNEPAKNKFDQINYILHRPRWKVESTTDSEKNM